LVLATLAELRVDLADQGKVAADGLAAAAAFRAVLELLGKEMQVAQE
jgi:hypothetical protein